MGCDRRTFLAGLGSAWLLGPSRLLADDGGQRLLSCRSDRAGNHFATLFDTGGERLLDVRLPGRGHAIALDRDRGTAVVFARRPGDFLVVLDLAAHRERLRLTAPADRRYCGHGVFSRDGDLLYVTENAFDDGGDGRIGIYDARRGFHRLGEITSHGIGPHEIKLLADGRTLVVANGGIRTHPDMPRAKLNLDSMQASLAYIDAVSGRQIACITPPGTWQRLGIRHIDVRDDGLVAIAMQHEGSRRDRPPLVGLHRRGNSPLWLHAPDGVQARMRNYCGSVVFTGDGSGFAVSSPRGGLVTLWSADGTFAGSHAQADVCGLAAGHDGIWSSDGTGGVRLIGRSGSCLPDSRWDNHLTAV